MEDRREDEAGDANGLSLLGWRCGRGRFACGRGGHRLPAEQAMNITGVQPELAVMPLTLNGPESDDYDQLYEHQTHGFRRSRVEAANKQGGCAPRAFGC
jgi:hypothetical protein